MAVTQVLCLVVISVSRDTKVASDFVVDLIEGNDRVRR